MNRLKLCQVIVLALVVSVGMTGCRKSPKNLTYLPGRQAGAPSDSSRTGGPLDPSRGSVVPPEQTTKLTSGEGGTELSPDRWDPRNFNPDREAFRQQTVHFEFDKSTIRSEDYDKIQAVAAFLKNETRAMVEVEGHCDERGTSEYNRALGERRALAVREYLIGLGIIGERVSTISFGEDQPADPGHDETAWAKNRRGVFVLLRPK